MQCACTFYLLQNWNEIFVIFREYVPVFSSNSSIIKIPTTFSTQFAEVQGKLRHDPLAVDGENNIPTESDAVATDLNNNN
jgi:hypothetical protein